MTIQLAYASHHNHGAEISPVVASNSDMDVGVDALATLRFAQWNAQRRPRALRMRR